ncbi:MAG: hypothetical protein KC613_26160 [Myxococcales bacterium]|nr:hypothetical protein [Myxococcales bacterium]MCB9525555.1 hypothetical protein [Myxococcales bacterium]
MTRLTRLLPLALLGVCFASPAFAQDGLLEGDPLLEAQLEERKPQEKAAEAGDPDAKLLEEVNSRREVMEKTINKLAEAGTRFAKIEKGASQLTAKMLKAHDKYLEAHRKALEAFQKAKAAGDDKGADKAAKKVVKLRNDYLKAIKGLQKGADKLSQVADKLQAKLDSGKAELVDEAEGDGAGEE